jgi:GT2 family glycosyltransferase/glycosyltransferase involved in cell wall biosynthesis
VDRLRADLEAALLREGEHTQHLRDTERRLQQVDEQLARLAERLSKPERRLLAPAQDELTHIRTNLELRRVALVHERDLRRAAPRKVGPPTGQFDVMVFPVIPWEFRFQRPQHLATQFARAGHRVFYFETLFHRAGPEARVRDLAPNLFGVRLPGPVGLSIYQSEIDESLLELWVQALNDLRRHERIEEAVGLVQLPFWTPLALAARAFWGWRAIYDCMDDLAGFGNLSESVLENESWLTAASDLVLATSRSLQARVAPRARRTLLLPNATDFAHFHQPPVKRRLAKLPRPIIGYYGALSHWFDARMVRRAARARPDWQFVLIGHVQDDDVARLERLPNVTLLGEQPYADLPSYLHQFDVATIPFQRIPLTEATNPVKFFEYLSAGKPVVATALPELDPYEALYYPVRSESDFIPRIEAALAEKSPTLVQSRLEVARHNTWEARFATLEPEIRSLFGRVAIIVVSFDNLDELGLCLDSLWEKTAYPNFEVIVVDNGSRAEVRDYLAVTAARELRLRLILNDENVGYARANNIGITAAGNCDAIVFLNDDTVVTHGWLGRMVRYLEDPAVGLVGPVTNWAGNEARIPVDYTDLAGLDRFAARYTAAHEREHREIASLALYCAGMRKAVLDELGPLDERFEIGMFEDDDLSRRVRAAGLKVICAEDIFIHHWGRTSFRRMDEADYEQLFAANRARFEVKWGETWQPHRYRDSVGMV